MPPKTPRAGATDERTDVKAWLEREKATPLGSYPIVRAFIEKELAWLAGRPARITKAKGGL